MDVVNDLLRIIPFRRNAEAWIRKGVKHHRFNRYGKAIRCFNKSLKVDPMSVQARIGMGHSLASSGHHDEAMPWFHEATVMAPSCIPAWIGLGNSVFFCHGRDAAEHYFAMARVADPWSIDIRAKYSPMSVSRRHSLAYCRPHDKEMLWYNGLHEIKLRTALTPNEEGTRQHCLGLDDEAMDCFTKALEMDPQSIPAWIGVGHILASHGRCDEAIVYYDKALRIEPEYPGAWVGKGGSLSCLGRYDEAIYCYNMALEMDPQDADSYRKKSFALCLKGGAKL